MDIIDERTFVGMLEELLDEGKVTQMEYDLNREHYSQMHSFCVKLSANSKLAQRQMKDVTQVLFSHKIKLERESIKKVEAEQGYHELMKSKEKVKTELASRQEQENQLGYELTEKKHDIKILRRKVHLTQKENEGIFNPKVETLKNDSAVASGDLEKKKEAVERERQTTEALRSQLEALLKTVEGRAAVKAKRQVEINKIKGDPERIRKQGDIVDKAVKNLEAEINALNEQIHGNNGHKEQLIREQRRHKGVEENQRVLNQKMETHRKNIEAREREKASTQRDLEHEMQLEAQRRERRVEIELKEKEVDDNVRAHLDKLAKHNKEFEVQKRLLKKKTKITQSIGAMLPNLEMQLQDCMHQLESCNMERRKSKAQLRELKTERDKLTHQLMHKASISDERKQALMQLQSQRSEMEQELEQWRFEETNMSKMIALLSAQREMKAREASTATRNEKETREEIKVKDLVILDLTKKVHEINNHLKEFSALYDVVKNERNKYVNLTQASSQAVAEMKEKIKILQNEVEILRNENSVKDKALHKERVVHQQACNQRDQLRLEANKCQAIYREKQEQVEQQIVEIDKLNSIINAMEAEMLKLKQQYELAVETRNFTGIQLIDRNDELCILYEKSNVQEQTLKQGEMLLQELDQSIRMLRLELAELSRQIEVTQHQMPQVPQRQSTIDDLRRQLEVERDATTKMCADLETPENQQRWRLLKGADPDGEQLQAKVKVLEERLNEKKEQLLEKDLVLEEISALSTKLRRQATEGRGDTLKLAKKVNEFQARIKDTTRKMMATVSELSMYQAAAIKLQQDKELKQNELDDAQGRFDAGEAPTRDAEARWYRSQRDFQMRQMDAQQRQQQHSKQGMPMPQMVTRTTAEPRPNAYIPDGDLGIPKPYGALAPFKPTHPGSTMRHIKKPKFMPIQI